MSIEKSRIGIIGGAGPMAGLLLYQKIIEICQEEYGCKDDSDFPYIMLLSYPFADMLSEGITQERKEILTSQIDECLSTFLENNIEVMAMACNTLHLFLTPGLMEKASAISFIHMIKECGTFLDESEFESRLVLCSNTSANSQLHASHFPCCYLENDMQSKCQKMIDLILAGKETEQAARQFACDLNKSLIKNGSKKIALVLGCTEFSVLNERFPLHQYGLGDQFIILDSNELVARKICDLIFKVKKHEVYHESPYACNIPNECHI